MAHHRRVSLVAVACLALVSAASAARAPKIISLTVAPATATIAAGDRYQFHAIARYSDGRTRDVSEDAAWQSSDPSVAAVGGHDEDADGITGLRQSSAPVVITAALGGASGSGMLTVTSPRLTSIRVTPDEPRVAAGATVAFTATGRYSDGSTADLTRLAEWSSSDAAVATIDTGGTATGRSEGTARMTARLGTASGFRLLRVTEPRLTRIAITPASPSVAPGASITLTVAGTFADGSTRILAGEIEWRSSDRRVATVHEDTGVVTARAAGTAVISATRGRLAATTTLTVTGVQLTSIGVTPVNPSASPGDVITFAATGYYSDGSAQDVTSLVAWASSDLAVATVSPTGAASALAEGTTAISATQGSLSGSSTLTVAARMVGLSVTPDSATMTVGETRAFTATAFFSDGSTRDVTAAAQWFPFDSSVVDVVAPGTLRALREGATYVQVYSNGYVAFPYVMVVPPTLSSVAVLPDTASVVAGGSVTFTARASYSDGSTADVTGAVAWSSSHPDRASIGATGVAHAGFAIGPTTITANLGSLTGAATLTVLAPPARRFVYASINNDNQRIRGFVVDQATGGLAPIPGSPFCCAGGAIVEDPLGRYVYAANGSQVLGFRIDPTSGALETIAPPNTPLAVLPYPAQDLAIDPTGRVLFALDGFHGQVLPYTIDALSGLLSAAGPAVATGSSPVSILVAPGGRFLYVPNFNDGTISGFAVNATTGALTPLGGSPFSAGPSGYTNVYDGAFDPTGAHLFLPRATYIGSPAGYQLTTFAIDAGTGALTMGSSLSQPGALSLSRPVVHPSGAFLHVVAQTTTTGSEIRGFAMGGAGALTALGSTPWAATNVGPVTLDPSGRFLYAAGVFDPGLSVFAIDAATAAVAPVAGGPFGSGFNWRDIVVTAGLTVTSATLDTLEVVPANATTLASALGGTYQFAAIGHYSDGSTQFLTNTVTWTAATAAVATITTGTIAPGWGVTPGGVATAVGYGSTTLTASYGSLTASTTWTVAAPPLVSIAVTPSTPTLAAGTGVQLHAVGTFSDGSTRDLTTLGTWTSSDMSVASVDPAGFLASALAGTATITIARESAVGSITLQVVAMTPTTPRFVYASINNDNQRIRGFVVDQATGGLAPIPGSPFCCAGGAIVEDPLGRYLYAANGSQVVGFRIDPTSGALETIAPPNTPLVVLPYPAQDLAIDPTGRVLFALDGFHGQVLPYTIDALSGLLSAAGPAVATGSSPVSILVAPGGRFLYVPNFNDGTISGFALNGATGALTRLSGSPFSAGPSGYTNVYDGAFDPTGAHLFLPRATYIGSPAGYQLTTFAIDAGTGALTMGSSLSQPGALSLSRPVVHPSGAFLHVVAQTTTTGSAIRSFAMGGAGALTALGSTPWAATNVGAVTLDPSGRFLYAAGVFDPGLSAFAIDAATAAVAPVAGGPFGSGFNWREIVVSPGLAVTSATLDTLEVVPANATTLANALGGTYQFAAIGHYSDGSTQFLTNTVTWTAATAAVATITTGTIAPGWGVTPGGVATAVGYGSTTLTASYGSLTASTTWTVAAPPLVSIAVTPSTPALAAGTGVQLHAIGTFSDGSTRDLTTLGTWTSSDTAVASVDTAGFLASVAAGTATITIARESVVGSVALQVVAMTATTPRFVYASINNDNQRIRGFVVDQATGGLAPIPGSPFCCAGGAMVQDPLGRYVYAANGSQVVGFQIDQASGALSPIGNPLVGLVALPYPSQDLAIDPTGRVLFALDGFHGQVLPYTIDALSGLLSAAGPAVATGSSPVSILVAPGGRFLYVPNFNDGTISGFALNGATGALTPLGGSPFSAGPSGYTNVYDGAFDPTGAHLFLPRATYIGSPAGYQLTTFAIDAGTGALTMGSSLSQPGALSLSRPVVHPSGAFLHVVAQTTTTGSEIRGFAMGGAGALTALGSTPWAATNVGPVTLDPSGRFLYAAGVFDPGLSAFAIDAATAAVAPVAGGPFGSGFNWGEIVVVAGPPGP